MNSSAADDVLFASDRMVLKERPSRPVIFDYADANGWILEAETPRDEETGDDSQVTWSVGVGGILHVSYFEDSFIGIGYIVASGYDPNFVSGLFKEIRRELRPWSVAELLDQSDGATEPRKLARTIITLGLAAPNDFHPRIFKRLVKALSHQERGVRHAALLAMTYSPFAKYRRHIREVMLRDPIPEIREAAEVVLEAFDATGVPAE